MAKVACLHCDLLLDAVAVKRDERAVCPRCQQTLYLDSCSFDAPLALLLSALLIYFPAVLLPFIGLQIPGGQQQVSLLTSVVIVAHDNMLFLAMTVFILVLLVPLVKMLGLLLVILPLWRGRLPFHGWHFGMGLTRFLLRLAPWNMTDVYLVGVLVSVVKLSGTAQVIFSGGFYSFVLLIVVNILLSIKLSDKRIWQAIARLKAT